MLWAPNGTSFWAAPQRDKSKAWKTTGDAQSLGMIYGIESATLCTSRSPVAWESGIFFPSLLGHNGRSLEGFASGHAQWMLGFQVHLILSISVVINLILRWSSLLAAFRFLCCSFGWVWLRRLRKVLLPFSTPNQTPFHPDHVFYVHNYKTHQDPKIPFLYLGLDVIYIYTYIYIYEFAKVSGQVAPRPLT